MKDSRERFTDKAETYEKYRPPYPREMLDVLRREIGLTPEWKIADIGSGTGMSSKLFIENRNRVFCVEPNDAMREKAEARYRGFPNFSSVNGTAERTGMADGSVDMVISGQAFHWFDIPKARAEFARILRDPGHVVLFWNERLTERTPFLRGYEEFITRFCPEYKNVTQKNLVASDFMALYGNGDYRTYRLETSQSFDFDGLLGRLLTSSYSLTPSDPAYPEMTEALRGLFESNRREGRVLMEYETNIYAGKIRG